MAPKFGLKTWNQIETKDSKNLLENAKIDLMSDKQSKNCVCDKSFSKPKKKDNCRPKYGRSVSAIDISYVERTNSVSDSVPDISKVKKRADTLGSVANLDDVKENRSRKSPYLKLVCYWKRLRKSLGSKFHLFILSLKLEFFKAI